MKRKQRKSSISTKKGKEYRREENEIKHENENK